MQLDVLLKIFLLSFLQCVDAFDDELIKNTLSDLKHGKTVETPVYDPKTYSRFVHMLTRLRLEPTR